MRTAAWALVLLLGFSLMLFSYYAFQRVTQPMPWTEGVMYVGRGEPGPAADQFPHTSARVRSLPPSRTMTGIVNALAEEDARLADRLRRALDTKVILYPDFRGDFTADLLASGRLPAPGTSEVVAGYTVEDTREIALEGRTFEVVGVLRREVALFSQAYVVPEDSACANLFDPASAAVENAYILTDFSRRLREPETAKRLWAAFPPGQFTPITGPVRVDPAPYCLYLVGFALLLAGGSALFVRLYVSLADRIQNRWLAAPFLAIRRWKRLFAVLHLVFFGAFILGSALVYVVPEVQMVMLSVVHGALQAESGPLAVAASAYASGNIPWAALVTLGINFFWGSLALITAPSLIVPGIGLLVMGLRSVVLGLVLAPSMTVLSGAMLTHSFTVLVELEAYILAAFFALMVPIYLFRREEGPTLLRRYGKVVLLNLQGNLLVFVVLAVAAAYEAVEVILQFK